MVRSDPRRRLLETIEGLRHDILALAQEIVRIPSVTPGFPVPEPEKYHGMESAVNRHLLKTFSGVFDTLDLFTGAPQRENLVAVLRGAGGGKSLIYNGHIDVAPPGKPEHWADSNPFSGRIEGGRLYGRGASDMKGGVVAAYFAAKALREAGVRLRGDLIIESVCGEELGHHDVGVIATIKRGYRAEAAVVVEPSGPPQSLAINPASTGALVLRVVVPGKSAHAALRRQFIDAGERNTAIGVNALEKALGLIHAMHNLERAWATTKCHPLFQPGQFTIHPGVIDGRAQGVGSPVVAADECTIVYMIWYPPGTNVDELKVEIEQHISTFAQRDPWFAAHPPILSWPFHWAPFATCVDHAIVRAAKRAYEQVTGGVAPVSGLACVCDATHLQAAGVPTINCGPGTLTRAHAPDEYVETEDVILATKVYAVTATEWCGVSA